MGSTQIQVLLAIGNSGQPAEADQTVLEALKLEPGTHGARSGRLQMGVPGLERHSVPVGEWTQEHVLWVLGVAAL